MKLDKKKELLSRFFGLAIGSVLFVGGATSAIVQVLAADVADYMRAVKSDEKIYGTNAFDEEYSSGIVFRNNSMKISNSDGEEDVVIVPSNSNKITKYQNDVDGTYNAYCPMSSSCYAGTNTSRDSEVYIDVIRGAILDNRYLDVREYIWVKNAAGVEGSSWGRVYENNAAGNNEAGIWYVSSGVADASKRAGMVYRELHFYENNGDDIIKDNGTDIDKEIEFKGVVALSDFDFLEGYDFNQGYHQAYVQNPTPVVHEEGTTRWIGPGDFEHQISFTEDYMLWVEVEGTPNKPLIMEYIAPSNRGSETISPIVKINYHLVGENPEGVTAPSYDVIAQYGSLTPKNPEVADQSAVNKYTFSGWYYDEAMTNPVIDKVVAGEDVDLYGKYMRDDDISITTSITNGTIDDSIPDAEKGEDYTIKYKCNDGYNLSSILVDDESVNKNKYPNSYTFENIESSHKISVTCEKTEEDIKAPNTGFGVEYLNYSNSRDSGLNPASMTLSSSIGVIGLLIVVRFFKRSRAMSFKK